MSWGWSTYNCAKLPALANYQQAKEHYEKVIPIRGRSQVVKPLGEVRRFCWYRIEKLVDAVQSEAEPLGVYRDIYACTLHGEPYILFMPDDTIEVKAHKWQSPTLKHFLTYSLRAFGQVESFRGKWYFVNKAGNSYLLSQKDKSLILKKDGEYYVPTNCEVEKKYKADRKAMNKILKRYKTFMDYGKTALAIDPKITRLELAEAKHGLDFGNVQLVSYYWRNGEAVTTNRANFIRALDVFNASGDLNLAYELLSYVAYDAGHYSYRDMQATCQPISFDNRMKEVFKYYFRDEVFTSIEQPLGVAFFDANAKYFK